MKHWAIVAWDAADAPARRTAHRAAHFARIDGIMDRLSIAGPMKDDAGAFTGSLVIVTAETRAEAQVIFEADPYFAAGVWERFEIHDFLPAAGAWIGGKTW